MSKIDFDFNIYGEGDEPVESVNPLLPIEKQVGDDGEEVEEDGDAPLLVVKEEDGEIVPDSSFSELAVMLLGDDIVIHQQNEDGEDEEIPLSEYNLTKEEFIDVVKNYIEDERNRFKENSISTEDLDETTLMVMKAVKNSRGNFDELNKLLQIQTDFVDPIKSLDLDDVHDQEKAVKMRHQAEGKLTDRQIDALIKGYKAEDSLRDEAEDSVNTLSEMIKNEAARLNEELDKKEEQLQSNLKYYKKTVEEDLKSKYKVGEKLAKKIADFAGKEVINESMKIKEFSIDKNYRDYRQDKDVAAELALFLYDGGKTYRKMIESELQLKVNIENKKRILTTKAVKPSSGGVRSGDKEETISFEKFFGSK